MTTYKGALLVLRILDPRAVEIALGFYKLVWGLIAAYPLHDPFKVSPFLYSPLSCLTVHEWGFVFLLMGGLQVWASWISGSEGFRRWVTTPTFCLFFVIWARYVDAAFSHPGLWATFPPGFYGWITTCAGWCVYRLFSPDHMQRAPGLPHILRISRRQRAEDCSNQCPPQS